MEPALYVVGTPIGHLNDITLRAREVLCTVDRIACEDTRVTRKLLQHIASTVATVSIHHHSPDRALDQLLNLVEEGKAVALVTDAGMPGIADPGGKLVQRAHERNLPVVSVPGPSALTTALSLSGFPSDRFLFLGFLPHKKGRETAFRRISETDETVVLYESPHRLLKTLNSLMIHSINKDIAVCRELTKIYESVIRGSAAEVLKHYEAHPDQVRGEVVIVIGPSS